MRGWALLLVVAAAVVACRPTPHEVRLPRAVVDATVSPGDTFTCEIVGEDKLPKEYEVSANGEVALPYINVVKVEGLEKHQIEQLVRDRLMAKKIFDDPVVVVNIKEFKSKVITVAGAVDKPNSFPYEPGMTLSMAIAKAGGMTPLAMSWNVKLVRRTKKGSIDAVVDYDAINENQIRDVALQPGDKITVPKTPY